MKWGQRKQISESDANRRHRERMLLIAGIAAFSVASAISYKKTSPVKYEKAISFIDKTGKTPVSRIIRTASSGEVFPPGTFRPGFTALKTL